VRIEDGQSRLLQAALAGDRLTVTIDGLRVSYTVAAQDSTIWLAGDGVFAVLDEVREASVREDEKLGGDAELISPMPGAVVAVSVDDGAEVEAGTVVVTVEAMKMEHALTAPVDGVVELLVEAGDQVKVGQLLARIAANKQAEAENSTDDLHR
jgi:acetyl-CoA/propionyl-CoA carboxylase biotin carboxyl carrier protein